MKLDKFPKPDDKKMNKNVTGSANTLLQFDRVNTALSAPTMSKIIRVIEKAINK